MFHQGHPSWCVSGTNRYETTNHLWLILEYCVGGDLMSLLRQDVRLPESSIHDFGRDMVVALQVRQNWLGSTTHRMVVAAP
jgi:serine/threonine protein kinase